MTANAKNSIKLRHVTFNSQAINSYTEIGKIPIPSDVFPSNRKKGEPNGKKFSYRKRMKRELHEANSSHNTKANSESPIKHKYFSSNSSHGIPKEVIKKSACKKEAKAVGASLHQDRPSSSFIKSSAKSSPRRFAETWRQRKQAASLKRASRFITLEGQLKVYY
eukprot:TRINITY_DN4993_c0_g1_i3.p1 TRINITY_DN4993_c0_g1~~TRINITY_DN4993_c0_g1_i3.p1  ORF type:complete len:164 (-),score=18.03 TRINITY_DN4993_c0_g1_i3:27-518(-)